MILQKYPTIDRTAAQILEDHNYNYNVNCQYGERCKAYRIPITSQFLPDTYWYIQAEKKIIEYKIYASDCNENIEELVADYHVIGQDGNGSWYMVIKGLEALPSLEIFQLWVEVKYSDNKIRTFFSEEYEVVVCDAVDMVYSCYDEKDNGGFDVNGAWIGYANNPHKANSTGHIKVRYFNNYLIRDLKVLYAGSQITYKAFNNRPVKSERTKIYEIYTEVLPYWYEEMIASAFAKGYVYIDGVYYSITDYTSSAIGDLCCERLSLTIRASKVDNVAMSCSTVCVIDDLLLPDCEIGELTYVKEETDGDFDCVLGNLTYTKEEAPPPTLACGTPIVTNETEFNANDGSITMSATGGTTPYQYSLDDGAYQSSNVFNNLAPATYTVNVKSADEQVCSVDVTVNDADIPTLTCGNPVATNETGYNLDDGTIKMSATGGVPPYEYSINNTTWQTSDTFTGLAPATYTVYVRDDASQVCSSPVIISEANPPALNCGTPTVTGETGYNTLDGTITINPTGGVSPYQYTLDGINYQSSNTFTNLSPGEYRPRVKDAANQICTTTAVVTEQGLPALYCGTPTKTDETDYNLNDGTITMTASGGISPYQYSIDNVNWQSSGTFTGLAPQFYTVYVKDAENQTCNSSVTINEVAPPTLVCRTPTKTDETGYNLNDGTITMLATDGVSPYQYSLDNATWQSSNTFTGLAPATYTVYVKDAVNQTCNKTVTINEYVVSALVCGTLITTNETGFNLNDGTAEIYATGGVTPYQYSLDNVNWQTSNKFTNLAPGEYLISVKDVAGQICKKPAVIEEYVVNALSCVAPTTTGEIRVHLNDEGDIPDGTITAGATGGVPPYQYSLDGLQWQSSNVFSNVAPGQFTVYVKDAANQTCQGSAVVCAAFDFENNGVVNPSAYLATDGVINAKATVTPTTPARTIVYRINGGAWQSSPQFTGLGAGAYTVEGKYTDLPGCNVLGQFETNLVQPPPDETGGDCESFTFQATAGEVTITFTDCNGGFRGQTIPSGWFYNVPCHRKGTFVGNGTKTFIQNC